MDNKLKIELWVAAISVVVMVAIGASLYFFYLPSLSRTTSSSTTTTTKTTTDKTTIKTTSDPNVNIVTPSRNDTLQVKSTDGTVVSVPVYTAPKK
jgi:hypothetical protein